VQIGMIGLGRMGANMVRRLMAAGHECVVYNQSPGPVQPSMTIGPSPHCGGPACAGADAIRPAAAIEAAATQNPI